MDKGNQYGLNFSKPHEAVQKRKRRYTNEVAIACDITEKTYQNYERITREPKLEILVRIADYFDVSLDDLVGRTDKKR